MDLVNEKFLVARHAPSVGRSLAALQADPVERARCCNNCLTVGKLLLTVSHDLL
jgi:hypothetical protein